MVFLTGISMKKINLIAVVLLGITLGCNRTDQKNGFNGHDSLAVGDHKTTRTGSAHLITPGRSAGEIILGQDVQEVFKLLGKADDGDAAMGKAWGIWQLKDSAAAGDIAVYSSYRDTSMTAKDVKQIVVSAANYATKEGLHKGSSLEEIRAVFPDIKLAESDVKGKDTLMIYDAPGKGIAFDLKKEGAQLRSVAITVHPEKVSVNSTYLTIHPGWKKVPEK